MPPVKPVREPDDRNGHVRFDERGRETERWTSRREWPRKTPLAAGAAGPVRHRARPRLYHRGVRSLVEEPPLVVQIGACLAVDSPGVASLPRFRQPSRADGAAALNYPPSRR